MAQSELRVTVEPLPLSQAEWRHLAEAAWAARDRAFVIGPTRVGAAVLTGSGEVFAGCNVEHRFRSHDVHAEVNAITTMVTNGNHEIRAILVVAERDRFTPCGACMDWIFQFGGLSCIVGYQVAPNAEPIILTATQLMPFYPY
jgi:cytidine deaminase